MVKARERYRSRALACYDNSDNDLKCKDDRDAESKFPMFCFVPYQIHPGKSTNTSADKGDKE